MGQQRKVSAETVDRGDILSEQREKRGTNVKSQGVNLISPVPTPRRWNCPVITTAMDAQFLQHGFDPHVAGGCLLAVGGVEGERLLERKQMLGAVAAGERLCDRLGTGVATVMAQGCQRFRVALASKDRADDAQTGRAGDVSDDVVELKIHLRQGLLHMLDVRGRVLQQTLALTHVGSQLRNLSFGSKAGPQQSKRMEPLQPLRIADIGLAPRDVLGVTRVDKADSKSPCIEKLENG